jgi:hypothetical protein
MTSPHAYVPEASHSNPNQSAHHGNLTPLHCATIYWHLSVVELLVVKGAEVEAKDVVSQMVQRDLPPLTFPPPN